MTTVVDHLRNDGAKARREWANFTEPECREIETAGSTGRFRTGMIVASPMNDDSNSELNLDGIASTALCWGKHSFK